jgi:hypothetical protein
VTRGRAAREPTLSKGNRGPVYRALLAALTVAAIVAPAHASKHGTCHTRSCYRRACSSFACRVRVAHKQRARRERAEMARYRRHPMPRCTWWPESHGDWTARNPSSTAGGRYQILASTWYAMGGPATWDRRWPAAAARHVIQERIARRVLHRQGLQAWVLC